jgi:hypothetical protein
MATNAKKIYRGLDPEKQTITKLKLAGAYLPGTFVYQSSDTVLTQATDAHQRVFLLGNREFMGQSVADAYPSGDTGLVFELVPTEPYIARFAAATYTKGQELTVSTAGRLAAAAQGDVVIGFYNGSGVALSAGDLDDFVVANSYIKP